MFFALRCLAVTINDLQSFEQQLIVFSLTFTWQYRMGEFDEVGPKTQYMDGETNVRPMEDPLLLTEFVSAQF